MLTNLTRRFLSGVEVVPWEVTVSDNNMTRECDGAIINERFILVAASCIDLMVDPTNITACNKDPSSCEQSRWTVKTVHSHSKFAVLDNGGIINDIALVELNETLSFSDLVQPVCLPLLEVRTNGKVARLQMKMFRFLRIRRTTMLE